MNAVERFKNVMQLCTNDRQAIEKEILSKLKPLVEMKVPYVFHSDHSLPPTINFDTYKYIVQLCREYGNY